MNQTDTSGRSALVKASPADGSWRRGFWSLIVTQFQGAFSDNALKNLVIFLIVGLNASQAEKHRIGELVGALFSLPFILFSMAGGYLADRHSKRSITIAVKVFEIAVMLFALVGLALNRLGMQLTAVFLMGVHSAFFGPSKYGLLPELLPEKRLSWGNGILELGTYVAIILGIVAASFMGEFWRGQQGWSGFTLVILACAGLATSLGISRVPAADPTKEFRLNFLGELARQIRGIRRDRPLALATLGNAYFNFFGALALLNVFFYGTDVLHLTNDMKIGLLFAALAMGIGAGSLAAGYLSGGKIEYGLVPLGGAGLTLASVMLARAGLSYGGVAWRLVLLGISGGFFIVPISALLQHRPDRDQKGAVLATANLLSFVGIFLASFAHYLFTRWADLTPAQIFLAGAVMTLAGTAYTLVLLPDSLLRFVLWVFTHSIYRIRIEGRDHIPAKGGALFVANHLSLVDALLLQASTDRPLRFIMFKGMYERWWIKPFARVLRVIPIASQFRPREMIAALREASDTIRQGEVVCIFAEGQITRIGQMLPFRRGFGRIMRGLEAPIIPIALDGVWGSIFSFEKGRFYWKLPRRIPYPVTVCYGPPMPPDSTPFAVRQVVQGLLTDAWDRRRPQMVTLPRAFLQTARLFPFRFAMADAATPQLRFGAALTRAVWLASRLRPLWRGQEMVGILLPPSVPAALVNLAALLLGKVPVNLNYTLSAEALASCAAQCRLRSVISARAFLDKVRVQPPCPPLLLEELTRDRRWGGRLWAGLVAWMLPAAVVERVLAGPASSRSARDGLENPPMPGRSAGRGRTTLEDLGTIIFSSGSTGEPKGVMLTHYNIASNLQQLGQTFGLRPTDRILGILPFFHSFGFTATLCLPVALGVGVVYHANPLEARAVGQLVRDYGVTFLLATPTFLQMYLRGCDPEDFGSLHFVMTGAEKLPERLTTAFEDKFGIRPLEGYGCTECAPAVAVNTRDFRAPGFRQVGAKRGTIGQPLPGVSVRLVNPDTRQPVELGQPGLLLVRGPNVMKGYLGRPDLTAEVLRDGWYATGDVAALDEDGFLQITDRLSRFSKIGGEMVPHVKLEEKLHDLAGLQTQSFVVTAVPDDKKGERLVVLHTLPAEQAKECLNRLGQSGLPNLWIPRPTDFHHVETLPYLGTGKLDLRKVRDLALQLSAAPGR